jgi:hypothetical protein
MILQKLHLTQVRIELNRSFGERSKADAAGFDPKRTYSRIYAFNQYLGPGGDSALNELLGAITYRRDRQDVGSYISRGEEK